MAASNQFDKVANCLQEHAKQRPAETRFQKSLDEVSERIHVWNRTFGGLTAETPCFPTSLALTFYAALLVVLAHAIYEAKAPLLIRRTRADEFAAKLLDEFKIESPDLKDRLRRAQEKLRHLSHYHPRIPVADGRVQLERYGETTHIPIMDVDDFWLTPIGTHGNPNQPLAAENVRLMRIAIEEGARAEYEVTARQSQQLALAAGILYLAAIILILWITAIQVSSIWSNAGFPRLSPY